MIVSGNTASPPLSKNGKVPVVMTGNLHSTKPVVQHAIDSYVCKTLDDDLRQIERRIADIEGKCGSSNIAVDSARKELHVLKQQVADAQSELEKVKQETISAIAKLSEQSRQEAESRYAEFVDAHQGECERLESELKSLKSRVLIGVLSGRCENKRRDEQISMWCKSIMFYLSLVAIAFIGYKTITISISAVDPELAKASKIRAYLSTMPKTAVCFLPFYLPLIWFACHMNRLMNQARRLMEEYAHKVVVSETYSGIAEQVDVLAKKGVETAKDLSANLLVNTISVICSNPNNALDKVKTVTPLSEMVDGASRLIESVGKVKQNP